MVCSTCNYQVPAGERIYLCWGWFGGSLPLAPWFPSHSSREVIKCLLRDAENAFAEIPGRWRWGVHPSVPPPDGASCGHHGSLGFRLWGAVQSNTIAFLWPRAWLSPPIWLYSPLENPYYHNLFKTMNQIMSLVSKPSVFLRDLVCKTGDQNSPAGLRPWVVLSTCFGQFGK